MPARTVNESQAKVARAWPTYRLALNRVTRGGGWLGELKEVGKHSSQAEVSQKGMRSPTKT